MLSLQDVHVASHWTSAPRYIRGHAQRPRPPAGRADGTTPPKKKCSTHFCIRIYYFKGSLKIKILYSIKNSFCLFFVPVNRTVPAAPGARDQLFPVASRRLVGQPGGDTRGCSASFGRGLHSVTSLLFSLDVSESPHVRPSGAVSFLASSTCFSSS